MDLQRNKEIDILKSFAIFLMVFDHVWWGNTVHTYIQSFHMPLFFIVSGYLWKSGRSVKEVAIKKTKTIMAPYIAFGFIYLAVLCVSTWLGRSEQGVLQAIRALLLYPTDMENMPFAPALWFLACFWICNLIYACVDNVLGKQKWIPILIISSMGMTYSTLSDEMLPFALEPVAVGILFMLIGQLIKQYNEKIFYWLSKDWVVILMLLVEALLAFLNESVDMRSARYHNCLLYILDGTIGTLTWWGVAHKAAHKVSKFKMPFLKWGGTSASIPLPFYA